MTQQAALHIFQERQPVTVTSFLSSGEELHIHGVAQITELPYLQVQLPKLGSLHYEKITSCSCAHIFFEIDQSVLTLESSIVRAVDHCTLLLKIEDHYQKKQERSAARIQAHDVDVSYRPLDSHGTPLREEKQSCQAINISKAGSLLRISEVVEPKQRLELDIALPGFPSINCLGRVERLALQKNGKIEIAVFFDSMDDASRETIDMFCAEHSDERSV